MEKDTLKRKGVGFFIIEAENLDKINAQADFVQKLKKGQKPSISFWKSVSNTLEGKKIKSNKDLPEELRNFVAKKDCLVVVHSNAYVNTGLNNSLDREFGLGGTAVGFIGVSSNSTAVTATTTFLNGASGGTAANTIIKPISPAATRSAQTVTGGATFVNADFTSGLFIFNKIGFLTTATDAGSGLVDVIGGTGGASPYNRTFVLDLTGAGAFSATLQIAVTAAAA